ncbi:hypothetical protein H0P51_01200 [Mycobacterium vicinigordonae]|uniref:Uncharacterized protein n=1 Tax=Mycobacterium vicinigordonae TaxID=1719132 RepID=A0A7D6DY41_9MYCO|nr:hypothetical protein H0P51_01200 [Mycobacterium vicinigordonae]
MVTTAKLVEDGAEQLSAHGDTEPSGGGAVDSRALERHDYVTRVDNPDDARTRIIELRPRGRQALRVMRSNAIESERHWEEVLCWRRLDEPRETVEMLLAAPDSEKSDAAAST